MAEDILESYPKTVARAKREKGDYKILLIKKRNKSIMEWIGRPFKPPLRNEDKEYEDEEEDIGASLESI